ncbi:hypothetical protein IWQ57_005419 [Coemansia nantahalensis]|uniref:Uncharacterized protein n=1 Tax=Coemansia nantahalensis TaxID=2789366 RepID=A0ACC1JMN1_9FUNG|nr:hypothetical protein IWQ57_005419 [Coemansia nantahalensis]
MDCRYQGTVHTPARGVVGEQLAPVTVSLEQLDPNGVPVALDDRHATGLVANILLASEDGALDLGYNETGLHLLSGTHSVAPEVLDSRLVSTFRSLAIHRPGRYRLCVRVFNIVQTVAFMTTYPDGPLPMPSDAVFVGYSDVLVIHDRQFRNHSASAPPHTSVSPAYPPR